MAGVTVAAWFAEAWGIMLLVGIAHRDWWHLMLTMGWHAALPLAFVTTAFTLGGAAVGGATKS